MSTPTIQTVSLLVDEALAKAGYASPPTALSNRAEDQWMNEIKNDMWLMGKKVKSLNAIAVYKIDKHYSFHEFPTDLLEVQAKALLWGTTTGTTQNTPSKSTCQLAATYGGSDQGKLIVIENDAATHSYEHSWSQIRTISSQTITYRPYLTNVPTSAVAYMIIDQLIPLMDEHPSNLFETWKNTNRGKPRWLVPLGDIEGSDSDTGYRGDFWIYPVPDQDYYLLLQYYLDLSQMDVADLRLTNLYTKWRNMFIQGIKAKCFENDDDNRAMQEMEKYYVYLKNFADDEQFGKGQKMTVKVR